MLSPTSPHPCQFGTGRSSPVGALTIVGLGFSQTVALERPRVLGQYALVYILDGSGSHRDADGRERPLSSGDFVFVFPEREHQYNPRPGTAWRTSFLCFQGPVFDLWREVGVLDPGQPVVRREPVEFWSRRLADVLGPTRQLGAQPPLVETGRLLELIAAILCGSEPGPAEEDRRWISRAVARMEATLEVPPDWTGLAAEFGLTADGFRKRFTRLTGQPPARYRAGRLIDLACALMAETRLTDQQIAERLGFCDPFYFSRKFKQATGRSPRLFRRALALGSAGR